MGGIARWVARHAVLGLLAGALLAPQAGTADARTVKQTQVAKAQTQPAARQTAQRKQPRKAVSQARRTAPRNVTPDKAPAGAHMANRPLVVIDPGHGGRDPGAIGASGVQEKAVTLTTALELRRQLLATGRYRVALTRSDDSTVSLDQRLAFARSEDADLFIAIHADASRDRSARGASVYVRSGSETTRLSANRGNAGRIATALATPDPGSAALQFSMIEHLEDDVRMVATPARSARLHVLGSRAMPSVLLEMGFLSNRQDEALLQRPAHRGIVVRSVKDAIDDYFARVRMGRSRT